MRPDAVARCARCARNTRSCPGYFSGSFTDNRARVAGEISPGSSGRQAPPIDGVARSPTSISCTFESVNSGAVVSLANASVGLAFYVIVSIMWLVPDRRLTEVTNR